MTREFLVPLKLPADPMAALEAAPKQYVDAVIVEGDGAPSGEVTKPGNYYYDRMGGGAVMDIAQPAAKVYKVNAQSVLNNTATLPAWDNDEFDTHDLWQPGTPSRFTIPTGYGGTYVLMFTGLFAANASGARTAWFRVNGDATHRIGQVQVQTVASGGTGYATTATVRLIPGDYVEVVIQQDSGAALNLNGGASARVSPSTFSITRFGA